MSRYDPYKAKLQKNAINTRLSNSGVDTSFDLITCSFRIESWLNDDLKRRAKQRNTNKAELCRIIVERWIRETK